MNVFSLNWNFQFFYRVYFGLLDFCGASWSSCVDVENVVTRQKRRKSRTSCTWFWDQKLHGNTSDKYLESLRCMEVMMTIWCKIVWDLTKCEQRRMRSENKQFYSLLTWFLMSKSWFVKYSWYFSKSFRNNFYFFIFVHDHLYEFNIDWTLSIKKSAWNCKHLKKANRISSLETWRLDNKTKFSSRTFHVMSVRKL